MSMAKKKTKSHWHKHHTISSSFANHPMMTLAVFSIVLMLLLVGLLSFYIRLTLV